MLMLFQNTLMFLDRSTGDPSLQDNGDGTTTATWDFQNPANYTFNNVSVSASNVTLQRYSSMFIDTSRSDFQQGTVLLNVDVVNDPGNVTLMNTTSAGTPQWTNSSISTLGGEDAYLNGGFMNRNYGISSNLNAEPRDQKRPIIKFNLTSLQTHDLITSALLSLKLENSNSADPLNVSVHQVNASWLEGTGDDEVTNDGVTYRYRDGSVLWAVDGGDFNPVPEDTVYSIQDQTNWYGWDISRLFREWQNETKPNYGLILVPLGTGPPINEKFFHSKESSVPGSRPKLQLNYIAREGGLANGTFVSRVSNAGSLANWGNISWNSTVPGQTSMTIETRSGDCSGGWSAWSAAYASPGGSQITSPPSQCIQYKVEMDTLNRTKAPILEEVRIGYQITATEGHIETEDLTPGNWICWETFNANENAQPGTNVTYWFSTDSGMSWTEIFSGDNLQSVPDPSIRFRANLTTSDPMLSPMLLNMSVTYQFSGGLDHIHMSVATWTGTADEWVDLDAIGHDSFHREVAFVQKWETDDPWGSVNSSGMYLPGKVGNWRVYCNNSDDTISNYTSMNVLPGSIARIGIDPWDPGTLTTDDTQIFDANRYDSMGNLIGPVNVNWSVAGSIGTIPVGPSSSGLLDATTPGFGTVTADDGIGHTNTTSVFQVMEGSLDRIIVQPDGITIQTGELQNFTAAGYDSDGNLVPLINPAWFTNAGNITSSSPTSATLEAYDWEILNGWIRVTATSQNNITGVANLQVLLPNTAPTILGTIPDQVKPEDYGSWSLDLASSASDLQDPLSELTWSFTGHDPTLTTISGDNVKGNHQLTFTTLENAFGTDEVVIWLRDSYGALDSQIMYINITSVNDRPTIQSITPFTIHYDNPYTYYFYDYVSDVETAKDDLMLTSSDPVHITFNGLWGTFTYPEEFDGTTRYPIVTVQDEDGGEMSTVLGITISDDYVPVLTNELPDVILYEGQEIKDHFDLDDYFDDQDGDSLFFTSGNIHTEIIIHENHSVDFIAPDDWFGVETVSFKAIDPANARAEDIILVTVLPVNDPPSIEGVPDLVVHYDDSSRPFYNYTFDLEPYISDVDNATAELTITTSDPAHLFFNNSKGTIMEVHYPQSMSGQTVQVRITVSDGLAEDYQDINIKILDDWPPETLSTLPEFTFFEDTTLPSAFRIGDYFADYDADLLTFSSISSNVTVFIDENTLEVDLSATLNWNGYELVTFRATDPDGAIAEQSTKVTVLPVNDAPEISDMLDITVETGEIHTMDLTDYIFDIDNELSDLTVFVSGENTKNTMTLAGFVLILSYPQRGTDHIHVEVSDGSLTTHGYFDVRIVSPPTSIWDQTYWPWSLIVVILGFIIFFILTREFLAKIYIDEIFLIYKNGSLIHHSVVGEQTDIDEDIFSNMLTAIQEFIKDSFRQVGDSRVKRIEFGDRKILIERGEKTYLAVVYSGHENRRNLRPIEDAIAEIEKTYEAELENWDGFILRFAGVQNILQKHLGDLKKGQSTEDLQRGVVKSAEEELASDEESDHDKPDKEGLL